MKHLLTLFIGLFYFVQLTAQCPGASLLSQEDVDAFSCPGNGVVTGDLFINDDGSGTPITNLLPLSGITSVVGILDIRFNNSLTSLDGLSGITSVGNTLRIQGNTLLTSLDGLSGITAVDGILFIRENNSLTSLDGLSGITSVGSSLFIQLNPALTSLDGLSQITSLSGDLIIQVNPALDALVDYCGLYNLLSTPGPGGLAGVYNVTFNGFNPTQQQIIDGGPCPLPPAPIPTMGEWGLILLVLLTLTFGAVFMTARKGQLAGLGGNITVVSTFRNLPFNANSYGRILLAVLGLVVLGFAIAILAFGYTLTNADIPGVLVCTPVLAYLLYLFLGKE